MTMKKTDIEVIAMSEPKSGWTALTRHGLVLALVTKHPRRDSGEIAKRLGFHERTVSELLGELVSAGYVGQTRIGHKTAYHRVLGTSRS